MPAYSAILCLLAQSLLLVSSTVSAAEIKKVSLDKPQFRRPTAIAQLDDSTVVVANRCGTLSVVELNEWSVVAEYQIGGRLTDIAVANDLVLVTDSEQSRLCLIRISRKKLQLVSTLPMPTYPVNVQVTPSGESCSVASRWARKLTLVKLNDEPSVTATIDLDFCPAEQLHIQDSPHLLVAGAFNGHLAVINTGTHEVETVHEFGAHNIRGMAVSADGQKLHISHQVLNDAAIPRRSDIIWGVMIANIIRTANLDSVLSGKPGALYSGQTVSVGYAGQGAGDPDSLFVDKSGRVTIALAGVDEVSIKEPDSTAFLRIGVGRRPTDLLPLSEGRFIVVNELSDSLTLIDTTQNAREEPTVRTTTGSTTAPSKPSRDSERYKKEYDRKNGDKYPDARYASTYNRSYLDNDAYTSHLSLGPAPELGPAERGERLFFSARLSHANWFSCHSCHIDGHSNDGLSDTFGDETSGAPKRVPSLLGVGETGPWAWNGKKSTLPQQIHQSAASTMRGRGVTETSANDISAFLKTLQPPPLYEPARSPADQALIRDGRRLFESLNCASCHAGATLTSADAYDVDLEDERGLRHFNPPSLRGVGYRRKLFHDNRSNSLEEVFTKFEHQLERPLTESELPALLRYLRSL